MAETYPREEQYPDVGQNEADYYADPSNRAHYYTGGVHEFPHVISGEHVAFVRQAPWAEDTEGKFNNWPSSTPKEPDTAASTSETSQPASPLTSAQARRNGRESERQHYRRMQKLRQSD